MPKKETPIKPAEQAPTVPDFAIIQGTIYRAAAIDAVQTNPKDATTVVFSLSGTTTSLNFEDVKSATDAHRLLVYLMTGTDLYPQTSVVEGGVEEDEAPTGEDGEGTNA